MAVEGTGLIARNVELDVLLIHTFISVDSVLLRIVPHGVVPPIEKRISLGLVHRIAEVAPRILLNQSPGDIIDLSVALQGKEHEE